MGSLNTFLPIFAASLITGCFQNSDLSQVNSTENYEFKDYSDKHLNLNLNKFQELASQTNELLLTSEQECIATYPTLKPENIRAGITIAGVTGTATEYPECSNTVTADCITTAFHPAFKTEGLAAKVLAGQTVAGIAGTAVAAKPDCTAANQVDCIATTTYKTMDLSDKDSGGALDLTDSNFETRVASASTFEYWDENGARHTNTGDADLVASNIDTGVTIFGTAGTAVAPDCSSISGSGTWILVPGDPDYGTNDFCVMKYEAKCSLADGSTCTASASSESPTSTAANTPWVNIDQQDSKTECASLGTGYHLITNDEWMTIATNVAAQGANWDGGIVDTNEMTRGHSDNNPGSACEADASDANAYVETNCATRTSSGTFNQRRTHTLSNGEIIWDLAGNVWEWTSYFNDEEKPTPNTNDWYQYTQPIVGTTTMPLTDLIPQVAIDNSWSFTQSIGQYYPGNDASGGALRRGGYWNYTTNAGVFTASLSSSPTSSNSSFGFRCAVAVP